MQVSLITSRLEDAGISYCVVGGMAAIAYGRPRLTLDADIVLTLRPLDCYFPGKSELVRWQLATRRRLDGPWGSCWFASPEAVVLHKLVFFQEGRSERHLEDIRGIIAAGSLDNRKELLEWIHQLRLDDEWAAAQMA